MWHFLKEICTLRKCLELWKFEIATETKNIELSFAI